MQRDLMELICCPACTGSLQLVAPVIAYEEIWEGMLQCEQCTGSYQIDKGMPHLYTDDTSWAPKAREARGWVSYHQNLGIYEQGNDAIDLKAPYYPQEPWIKVGRNFEVTLEQLNLTGEETILDLGAGRGWAAKHFALLGCRVVALDITSDMNVGLGRARALMEDAGIYFERVIADGERLPFQPEKFDVVFCASSLHHFSDLTLLLHNVSMVLKQGGRLCAFEPSISILEDEEELLTRYATAELELGINECRPNFVEYRSALESNNLQITEAFPIHTHQMSIGELREWAEDVGAVLPRLNVRQPARTGAKLKTFLEKRRLAIVAGKWRLLTDTAESSDERESLAQAALLWVSNELFLIATKKIRC